MDCSSFKWIIIYHHHQLLFITFDFIFKNREFLSNTQCTKAIYSSKYRWHSFIKCSNFQYENNTQYKMISTSHWIVEMVNFDGKLFTSNKNDLKYVKNAMYVALVFVTDFPIFPQILREQVENNLLKVQLNYRRW